MNGGGPGDVFHERSYFGQEDSNYISATQMAMEGHKVGGSRKKPVKKSAKKSTKKGGYTAKELNSYLNSLRNKNQNGGNAVLNSLQNFTDMVKKMNGGSVCGAGSQGGVVMPQTQTANMGMMGGNRSKKSTKKSKKQRGSGFEDSGVSRIFSYTGDFAVKTPSTNGFF